MNEFGNVGDRKYMYARIEQLEADLSEERQRYEECWNLWHMEKHNWDKERDRLREALDWIEAEPEDPHKVQQRAREALGKAKDA